SGSLQSDDRTMQSQGINEAYICKSTSVELAIVPQETGQQTSISFIGNAAVPLPSHHSQQCQITGISSHLYVQFDADGGAINIHGDGTYGYDNGSADSLNVGHITITSPMTINEVYDGATHKFYVNGQLLVQFSFTPPQHSQGMVITLGAYNPTGP